MNRIFAIAFNTFKEAVRNRVLYVLLFFAVLVMFGAWVAGTLSIDDSTKIVRDLGIASINIISLLIAVFVGIGLVYNDLDKKTIYTIVSKPISRWQFLVGKYVGLMLTISVNVLIMTWIFASVLHFREFVSSDAIFKAVAVTNAEGFTSVPRGGLLLYYFTSIFKAIFLGLWHILSLGFDGYAYTSGLLGSSLYTMLEMSVIVAFAVLFSSFSSPTLSAFLTVIVFIIGRMNQDLYLFTETLVQRAGGLEDLSQGQLFAYYFARGASFVCPNLSIFDKREQIGQSLPLDFHFTDIAYGVVYTVLVITIAVMVFNRRNFK